MKNHRTKFAAVAFVLCARATRVRRQGRQRRRRSSSAVHSGSADAIIAEVERAEASMCERLHPARHQPHRGQPLRRPRRRRAGGSRSGPALQKVLAVAVRRSSSLTGDSLKVRNAADFLGRTMSYTALPALRTAIQRDGSTRTRSSPSSARSATSGTATATPSSSPR